MAGLILAHFIAPIGQDAPAVQLVGTSFAVFTWSPPSQPNGILISYVLTRWSEFDTQPANIFSGLAMSFNDTNLEPGTMYSYALIASNSAGNTTSANTSVVTVNIGINYELDNFFFGLTYM